MNRERETDLPFRVIRSDDEQRCADLLLTVLRSEPGVRGITLDMEQGILRLRYNSASVSISLVQEMARRLGVELGANFSRCAMRMRGVRCSDCLRHLEERLASHPGVARVTATPATESIVVEYDSASSDLQDVEAHIQREGYAVRQPLQSRKAMRDSHEQEALERTRMAWLTGVCLTALLLAWGGERAGILVHLASLVFYVIAYLAGGFYSTARALKELQRGSVNVDLLMIAAASGAAMIGEWPEGGVLLFLFSLSNTLEKVVLGRTRHAIEALMGLTPDQARVRRDGEDRVVAVDDLKLGDILVVRPAERIAADGNIVAGSTTVDQSMMTGESIPVDRKVGDFVYAGTLNQQGAIEARVTRVAGDTTLARIVRLVEEAQSEKADSQRFTDWFGQNYTIGVLGAAALTLIIPWLVLQHPFPESFYRAMTVLVVASPCAVVISIPAAILSSVTSAARGGVLFKGGAHLERAAAVSAIAFDKTGTLTIGRPRLIALQPESGVSEEELLKISASAENLSEHPLARAIVDAARERGLSLLDASDLKALVGRGIRAKVTGKTVWIGKAELFTERGVQVPEDLSSHAVRLSESGNTTMFVGDDSRLLGVVAVADILRPGTQEAIDALRKLGIRSIIMLTGDNERVAQSIAKSLGIDFEAELLPEDKLRVIRRLREQHQVVAMVGDGINDAPSLAAANLGISLGGAGTDVAMETADVVLMADDLRHLPYAISLARESMRIIRQNLVFAFLVMATLLAVTFFATLRLPFAVIGHEGSTVIVIFNALRLLMFPRPSHSEPRA